jgi:hypothetical protein
MMKQSKFYSFLIIFSIVFMAGCASGPKTFPYFITRVTPGGQNEWVAENISEPNAAGIIYTQLVPLSGRIAALITVGKINNMVVAQAIVTVQSFSTVSWSYIELDDLHFDGNASPNIPLCDAVYITINEPNKFIKALQQQKTFNAKVMVNMDIYSCKINGNLDLF